MIELDSDILPYPPEDILRGLGVYDPRLHLNFDPKLRRWQLWRRSELTGRLEFLFNYQNPDGTYRALDAGIYLELDKGRWLANHPEILHKHAVDDLYDQIAREQKAVHDDMIHISKDSSLKKRFEDIKEKMKSISLKEWSTPKYLKEKDGSVARDEEGNPVQWVPHKSLTE